MSDIDELQRRITAAMDRVATGLGALDAAGREDPATVQALEEERTANAQLSERVRTLKSRIEEAGTNAAAENGALRAQVEQDQARMAQLDIELQRVRRANAQLTDACAALRKANEEGVGEPHLINKAMLAELDGLRAARAADVAEASAIIEALTALVDAPTEDA